MLTLKEDELERLKGRKQVPVDNSSRKNMMNANFDLDAGYDSSTVPLVVKQMT